MQLAATLLLLLSTPFFLRFWGDKHPTSLDRVTQWAWSLVQQVPITISIWVALVLFGLGLVVGSI